MHGSGDPAGPQTDAPATAKAAATFSGEYVFTRMELQRVLEAIRASLGCGHVPIDSPQRLQDALSALIAGLGGHGEVAVRRSPAALLTPEYWQIAVRGLDSATHASLARVFRLGRP